jgi:hypothetical protein
MRYPGIDNDWSEVQQFSLSLPVVTGLTPSNDTDKYNPTFCWDPLIGYDGGTPIMAAARYQIQVSRDPNFSTIYDQVNVVNHCYTAGRRLPLLAVIH